MWLVDETSLACWRPIIRMVGLSAVSLATDTSSLGVGSVTSIAEMSRPRYDCPTLKLRTSGNAARPATIFSDCDVLQPDLVFFGPSRRHLVHPDQAIRSAPDLVVEILSASTERIDRGRKMQAVARFGVPRV